VKIRRQQTSTMVRGRVSEAVSPFAEQSLNHSLGLAVGPRSVRSGTNVLDAELLARCGEESRAISIAIVGQKASNEDATLGEPSDSSMKEGDRRPLSFVAEYFHVCQSRSVIDANMSELPAGSRSMSPIAGDPMPDPVDPSELLHIDVQQVSGTAPFVSPRRWPRLKTAQTRQTCLPDDSSNRGATEAHRLPNLPARQSLATQHHNQRSNLWRGHSSASVWSRATIVERHHSAPAMPTKPLIAPSSADAGRARRNGRAPSFGHHALDQQRSTRGATSRILVNVHPGSFCATCSLGDFQDRRSRLDGQFLSVNNVLRHHS